jgi:hypothetical protein
MFSPLFLIGSVWRVTFATRELVNLANRRSTWRADSFFLVGLRQADLFTSPESIQFVHTFATARRRVDVNLYELDRVLDGARQAPLSEADYEKVKDALHAMAAMLVRPRNTEKTSAVLDEAEESSKATTQRDTNAAPPAGHHATAFTQFSGSHHYNKCGKGECYEIHYLRGDYNECAFASWLHHAGQCRNLQL